jgi:GntR family transcriptional regulator, gluconate operon transcriptional repressor
LTKGDTVVTQNRPTRAPALGEQLAAVLREGIVRRTIAPGTHLVEDALAAEYDVSRGPVRDALRMLESQGLVEARRRGFHVIGLSSTDIDDLYELREALEVTAATRAIDHASEDDLAAGRAIVAEMVDAADRADAAAFAEADLRFHALLYRMGGNRRIQDVWQAYEPVLANLMQLTVEEDVDLHPSADDHGGLLDLIVAGDADALAARMREHLQGAHTRMTHAVTSMADAAEERAS